jgi:hypothetical protein
MERMDRPENRSRLAEARRELEGTRARAAEASEALARGEAGRAAGAGTRAERALDRMRDQLQRRVSRALSDEMRQLRAEAQRLAREQEKVGAGIRKGAEMSSRPAATPTENRRLAQALRSQKQGVSALLERIRRVTEDAEASSPLLSRKLYDTLRRAKLDGVERSLERLGDMLEHGMSPQAATEEPRVRESLAALEKGVGDAAKGVLGDDVEALRLAQAELEALVEEARQQRNTRSGVTPPSRPSPASRGTDPSASTPTTSQLGGGSSSAEPPPARGGEVGGGSPSPPSGPNTPGWEAAEGFRAWADRLRDVQELLGEPGLRTDAARILDRARLLRAEARRHAERPQWTLLETEVVRPLAELRDKVNEELRRVSPDKDKLAPIDRDPVPSRYSELVRRYYKSLARE